MTEAQYRSPQPAKAACCALPKRGLSSSPGRLGSWNPHRHADPSGQSGCAGEGRPRTIPAGYVDRGREKGTCDNRLTIRRDEVEARVLKALQEKLLRQDLFDEFCDVFTPEMNRLRMEHRASFSAAEREIERIEVRRKKLIEMVMNGVAPSEVRDEMNANAARREALKAKLAAADEPPPLLHPEMARIYRAKVTELARALQEQDSRSERPLKRCAASWTPLC
jgi:hypothetical protein